MVEQFNHKGFQNTSKQLSVAYVCWCVAQGGLLKPSAAVLQKTMLKDGWVGEVVIVFLMLLSCTTWA